MILFSCVTAWYYIKWVFKLTWHYHYAAICELGPKKLIRPICFSGTARVTINPPIKNFYCISSIHIEKSSMHHELSV